MRQHRRPPIAGRTAAALVAAAVVLLGVVAPGLAQVTVDLGVTHQTMEGFGASARVWDDPHVSGADRTIIPVGAQREILTRLYTDLGLTRMRSILEAAIEVENDDADPLTFDWSKFNFAGKRNDAHVALVKQAIPYGLQTYFPTTLWPERWITEDMPEEHAEWVLAILLRWRTLGLEPPFFSVVNEPGYERSRIWSGQWVQRVIRALGPRMREAGLKTMLVVPDDLNPSQAYQRASVIMDDPEARPYVGALAYHLYGVSVDDAVNFRELAARHRVPVWMTEYSDPSFRTYAGAMEWITGVHHLIATGGASAVDYMWGFFGATHGDGNHSAGHSLIGLEFDHGRYRGRKVSPAYHLTGQFSRFVRPGHVRVEAHSGIHGVLVTAYRGSGDVVVVAINTSEHKQDVQVSFAGGRVPGSFTAVRTSATERWAALAAVPVRDATANVVLSPRSVTTFVGKLPAPDGAER